MYYIYNVLVYLAAPVAILVQLWRGLRDPSYREGLRERFGLGPAIPGATIWIHAVSVGEVQAAQPLITQLQKRHPNYGILLTTVTPTGAARARLLFGDRVHLRYVPLDLPGRSEEHTSELQSQSNLVCRLLLERYGDHRDLHSFPTRRSSDLLDPCGVSRRSAGGPAADHAAPEAPPELRHPAYHRHADRRRPRAAAVRRPRAPALRAARPAGVGQALLRPRAAEARNDPRD